MTDAAERDQGVTATSEIETEHDRAEAVWGRWLQSLSEFASETDPRRACMLAAQVGGGAPGAIHARLKALSLRPLVFRLREHRAMPLVHLAAAAEAVAAGREARPINER